MPDAHLHAHWRGAYAPLVMSRQEARVSNGVVHVGDAVRELPAPHHIQPCACTLCRERPESDRVVRVHAIGIRDGLEYVVLPGAYECPALEVERIDS
jgi:hypothetical protein